MKLHYQSERGTVHHGDCLDVLRELPDASVDAVVTDPPYGLEFMGKDWDAPWSEKDVNADAGFRGGGIGQTKGLPSFTGSTNPKCQRCKGTRRGRRDGSAKVPVCLCTDGGVFPNHRAIEMRAFQAWCEQWATECLRVLKPGGHMLAFGGTRTWHRLACAIEDAGFEIRDNLAWLYGSGFPKSLDVSKAIDKAAGAERTEVVGTRGLARWKDGAPAGDAMKDDGGIRQDFDKVNMLHAPATADAARWQGWGTALKPAYEPIVLARKPLAGTVAGNVLAWGTGALNVDGCRVGFQSDADERESKDKNRHADFGTEAGGNQVYGDYTMVQPRNYNPPGRWPANVVLDEAAAAMLDEQSGESVTPGLRDVAEVAERYGDRGGASRFFYTAKAGSDERPRVRRDAGGDTATTIGAGMKVRQCKQCGSRGKPAGGEHSEKPWPTCGHGDWHMVEQEAPSGDYIAHPTVKPLDLMRWLVRLVTPPGGTVLEPFAGSGTTVEACLLEGFRCVAVEREADYLPLILQRIHRRVDPVAHHAATRAADDEPSLFDLLGGDAA